MKKRELGLWTPLIGFDVEKPDRGAAEYLENVGEKPDSIGLFVYNADIINYHEEGMPREKKFPPDYCNYYGAARRTTSASARTGRITTCAPSAMR